MEHREAAGDIDLLLRLGGRDTSDLYVEGLHVSMLAIYLKMSEIEILMISSPG